MIDRLELLEKRYDEINSLLMQNDIISDVSKSRELSIELKSICYFQTQTRPLYDEWYDGLSGFCG